MNKINPLENKIVRIAMVGCGRISEKHLQAFAKNQERCVLVALCDSNNEKVKKAKNSIVNLFNPNSKSIDAKEYENFDLLIEDIKKGVMSVDLITLATPSGLHHQQVIASAKAGVNVCTEKPMATNWKDGLDMVDVCKKSNVNLFVIKQNRLNKTLQLVKNQIERGRFGKIALVTINVFWHRPQKYYDMDEWRGTWDMDGGALMNQASHYIDLLHWLIGPVSTISASINTLGRDIEVEDTAAIQIKWKEGTLGTMAVTMLTYPKNLEGSITILGEKGTVKIGGTAVNKIDYWKFSDTHNDDNAILEASYETEQIYGFGHAPYFANVFDVINKKEMPICDGEEGLKSLELLIASYKSASDNKIINLPLPV